MNKVFLLIAFLAPVVSQATYMRGNLNLSYQASEAGGPAVSTFSQILNLYLSDRLFYSNDLTLGAYVFHSQISSRDRGDFRIRYSTGLTGHKYNFYSSYSPYTIHRPTGPADKVRVFQASLAIKPRYLPDINTSYNSVKRFTADDPPSESGVNYSWNLGTHFTQSFGTVSAVYQRQHGRVDRPARLEQTLQTVNFGYDIARRMPLKINGSASYSYTGSRLDVPPNESDYTNAHNGASQIARPFGQWLSLSASSSARFSEYERLSQIHRIEDLSATGAANAKLRHNISLVLVRGYSSNENRNETTSRVINDYVSLAGVYTFGELTGAGGRVSVSRGLYFESAQGRTYVTSVAGIFDVTLYRETNASVNISLAHNDRVLGGRGKYQMTRSFDINSRPLRLLTISAAYQSSLASNRINFVDNTSDNLSLNVTHTLKWYFNYSVTYTRSTFLARARIVVSSLSLAMNYRLSQSLSLLASYTRRDLGRAGNAALEDIDRAASGRLTWLLSRRVNLTLNYAVSSINSPNQSQNYGGYLAVGF